MSPSTSRHTIIVGAGAAGLMAGKVISSAGEKVTILEARDRCGGRIWPLDAGGFGYRAEGGAEFIHGAAPVTKALIREAGLSFLGSGIGERWDVSDGVLSQGEGFVPHEDRMPKALQSLTSDMPLTQFLQTYFGGEEDAGLRAGIIRMTEGYDAADPNRASTFALRDEWLGGGDREGGRIAEGYGALIDFLAAECRNHGADFHFGAEAKAIAIGADKASVRCADGTSCEADRLILSVPLPILHEIEFSPALPHKLAAARDIGFGDVVKILLGFKTPWWARFRGQNLTRMAFLMSDEMVPTWWTQYPDSHPVLTGWLAGPRAEKAKGASEAELIEIGITGLANAFKISKDELKSQLMAARAFHWGSDPFARGAYSYATPESKAAQAELGTPVDDILFFSGEALYGGKDMGTVEAALASGQDTARAILALRAV